MTSDVYVGNAGVAQRIRASDYGSEGWGFESLRPHHETPEKFGFFEPPRSGGSAEDSNGIATELRSVCDRTLCGPNARQIFP